MFSRRMTRGKLIFSIPSSKTTQLFGPGISSFPPMKTESPILATKSTGGTRFMLIYKHWSNHGCRLKGILFWRFDIIAQNTLKQKHFLKEGEVKTQLLIRGKHLRTQWIRLHTHFSTGHYSFHIIHSMYYKYTYGLQPYKDQNVPVKA